ncbi:cyclic nucleotide-binding domain-containing protein [Paracoccus aminovorans]|uniref:cyclic nucleotide-binding domain-containing protein n=1 Tax=Paracoccus aminovorans TaxID=34004 RepID=UPI003463144F
MIVARNPDAGPASIPASLGEILRSFVGVLPVSLVFLFVILSIYLGWASPTEASAVGVVGCGVVAALSGDLRPAAFLQCLLGTAEATVMIFIILLGADMLNAALALTNMTHQIADIIVNSGVAPPPRTRHDVEERIGAAEPAVRQGPCRQCREHRGSGGSRALSRLQPCIPDLPGLSPDLAGAGPADHGARAHARARSDRRPFGTSEAGIGSGTEIRAPGGARAHSNARRTRAPGVAVRAQAHTSHRLGLVCARACPYSGGPRPESHAMSHKLTALHRRIAGESRLFAGLPPAMIEGLLDVAQVRRLARGQALFHQGDPAQAIHIMAEGWLKLYRIAPNGAEAVVGVMTRGQSFGEPIALRRAAYPVSAEASTACEVVAVPAQAFLNLLQAHPEAAIAILSATFLHLQGLVEQIEQLKARSGAQRVAEFLLDLCPPDAESTTVVLPYDKMLIAGRLGMKPESLSRSFARLRQCGVRIDQASAVIDSVARLREVAHAETAP